MLLRRIPLLLLLLLVVVVVVVGVVVVLKEEKLWRRENVHVSLHAPRLPGNNVFTGGNVLQGKMFWRNLLVTCLYTCCCECP